MKPHLFHPLLLAAAGAFTRTAPAQGPAGPPATTPLPHPQIPAPADPAEAGHPWWLIAIAATVLLLLAALAWRFLRRPVPRAQAAEPPLKLAHRRLLELLRDHADLPPSETGHRVSVILREYQMGRYGIPAPFRTREELFERGDFAPSEEKRERFAPLAQTCDQLAFAPSPATAAEAEALVRAAIEALRREVFHSEGALPAGEDPGAAPPAADVPAENPAKTVPA